MVLAVTIREDGTVEDATVTETGGPAFDAAAVDAVRQFVFSPAEVDGKPTRIRILYRYDFVERVIAPTTGIFSGVVMDREANVPIRGVTVSASNGRSVVTDEAGRFEFLDTDPGTIVVTLEGERLTALSTEETITAGERLEATYEVFVNADGEEGDDMEILVSAPAIERQAVSTEITADEARKVPGTQGDVLRVVESLPGVARASLGTGALVIWGAAPEDTGVYVDGVPVPRLYHDGGLRSVVGSDFVSSVELVPGGYGAAWGRGLGGLVSVTTERFDEGTHGSVQADVYDAAASIHGPAGRWNYGIGARYGYVGPLLETFAPDVEDTFPIPHYADGQLRFGLKLRPNETLDLTALASSDQTRKTAPNPDPARVAAEERRLSFQRLYLRYARDIGDGTRISAVLFGGADQSSQIASFGQVETAIRANVRLFGLRGSYRTRVATFLTVEGGLDSFVPHTDTSRDGSVAVPSREGDIRVFGQPPPDQISSDQYTVTAVGLAPYVEADVAPFGEVLHVVSGLRLDPYARSVSRASPQVGISPTNGVFAQDLKIEPRLTVRWTPSARFHAIGAWGHYGQQPAATDLSASFGNPLLPASTAIHYVLGAGVNPTETLSVEVTAFHTTQNLLAMRNLADQPARAEALVSYGDGRTTGAQTMIRLDPTAGFYGWISWTVANSERRASPSQPWRPSDYDQRHALTALGGFEWPGGFELGVRLRVASGFPRSEVVGAFYDNRRDLYQPVFGDQNGIRLPTFFQADIRAAQHFDIGETGLDLSLEVQNMTDQVNVEEFVYDADYTTRGAIGGLPILPVLGVRWSF